MGIPRGTARLLLEETRQRPFSGTVLQIGRSSVYFTDAELRRWAGWHGVDLRGTGEAELSHDVRLARQGCLGDRTFFQRLGFDRVEACDISEWEGAEHIFDLNEPVPEALRETLHGRFDAIVDPGSLLQIFHQPNVLRNLHDLIRVGGRIIHAGEPSNNHMDLGFYMYSPTFFDDYYRANGYRIECFYLCDLLPCWHLGRLHSTRWKVYRYEPGCLDHLNYGRYGGGQTAIFMVATKTAASTGGVVPQLGQFVRSWQLYEQRRKDPEAVAGETRTEPFNAFERFMLDHPRLSQAYLPVKLARERLRRLLPRRMPPLVARY
jgi:hypothetical protein